MTYANGSIGTTHSKGMWFNEEQTIYVFGDHYAARRGDGLPQRLQ
jgi:hypothetical protein